MYYDAKAAGELIRKLRIERDMTQEVLSGLAGMARSHIAMIESGKKDLRVDTLWRIAAALGLRLSEFIRMLEE